MPFGRRTPPTVKVECEVCHNLVSTSSPNAAREVRGWLVPRRGGGPNHIRYQKPTGRMAHVACLDEAENPGAGKQGSLW